MLREMQHEASCEQYDDSSFTAAALNWFQQ